MISSRARFALEHSILNILQSHKGRCYFLTCTFPLGGRNWTIKDFSNTYKKLWRSLRASQCVGSDGVRCWERHKSGGWHVHFILTDKANLKTFKTVWKQGGGGHVHISDIIQGTGSFIARYLSCEIGKASQKDFSCCGRAVRSWACFGSLAVSSLSVKITSPCGRVLSFYRGLSRSLRFRLISKINIAFLRGWFLSDNLKTSNQINASIESVLARSLGCLTVQIKASKEKGTEMQIHTDVEYIGQRLENYTSFSDKTHCQVTRNWLAVSFASDDGDVMTGRLYLPDGDIQEPAPLAKRGDRVRVTLSAFQTVKGATVATLAGVAPIAPIVKVVKPV